MKKWWWIILVLVAFGLIQFLGKRPPVVTGKGSADLIRTSHVPQQVVTLLRTSCYDCHSNETHYPWYAHVAPVSWLVNRDVREGRKALNFSNWADLKLSRKLKMLNKIGREVDEGEMPMFVYPLMHRQAKLSAADRKLIVEWTESYGESLFSE